MNLVGLTVTHPKFGEGKITRVGENKMDVDFRSDVRTFIYPNSFKQHFDIEDQEAKEYITDLLSDITQAKKEYNDQRDKKILATKYALKNSKNSQAVFALEKNGSEDVLEDWTIYTGSNLSGISKGKPRVPKNLNINSACLLTSKSKTEDESKRCIVGLFMIDEDFIGENCLDGNIPAHYKYRINWTKEAEQLLFWNYFAEDSRLEKWGSADMKYLPSPVIKTILEDMIELSGSTETKEEIKEFHDYFCQMNHL